MSALVMISLGACMGPSLGTPEQVARDVVDAVDQGRPADAASLVKAVAHRPELRDLVFPQLYSEAQERYESGDALGAAGILRPLAAGYRSAISVRVALSYSLFLLRAETASPSPEEISELESVLDELDAMSTNPPAWLGMVRAQNSIDRGDLEGAREAMAIFHQKWDGEPADLGSYVDDLDRYLSSH